MLNYLRDRQKRESGNTNVQKEEKSKREKVISQENESSLNNSMFDLAKYEYTVEGNEGKREEKFQKK